MSTRYDSSRFDQQEGGAAASAAARTEREPRADGEHAEAQAPRLVIRGESFEGENFPESGEAYELLIQNDGRARLVAFPLPKPDGVAYAAITDYLNCTFPAPFGADALTALFQSLFAVLGPSFGPAKELGRGFHGYKRTFALGESSALLGIGGQRGTVLLSLPGEACHLLADWRPVVALLRDELAGRITRWDGAVDDFEGKHSVDLAAEFYKAGLFNAGGNEPTCNQQGNWIKPDGRGRSFYVGQRKNGKMIRVYEKGMQLGSPFHPWTRWEVELHNVDRVIPWDVLLQPGSYVAGAYPKALGWVQDETCRIRTVRKSVQISYEHLVHYASVAYGCLFDVMLKVEGSADKVVEKLRQPGFPSRLDHPPLPGVGKVLP